MLINNLFFILLFLCVIICFIIYNNKNNKKLKKQTEKFDKELLSLSSQIEELHDITESQKNVILSQRNELATLNVGIVRLKEKTATVESQKKSSEVRLGQMAENFMPFIRDYPYNHKNFRFLANPVDGLQVESDSVIFIEFKSGGAKLSKSQKHIKDMVAQGKVRFETFRVDENGTHLKIDSSMPETNSHVDTI